MTKFWMKIVCEKRGRHVHCTFFTTTNPAGSYVNHNTLIVEYDGKWPTFNAWLAQAAIKRVPATFEDVAVIHRGFEAES